MRHVSYHDNYQLLNPKICHKEQLIAAQSRRALYQEPPTEHLALLASAECSREAWQDCIGQRRGSIGGFEKRRAPVHCQIGPEQADLLKFSADLAARGY